MKKRIMTTFLIFVLIVSLAACGGKIKQGEVIEKTFTPAHTETRLIPMYISNGKTGHMVLIPFVYHYADKWEITIQRYDKNKEEMRYITYRVTKEVYDSTSIGTEFVYSKDYTPEAPEYTRERVDKGGTQ